MNSDEKPGYQFKLDTVPVLEGRQTWFPGMQPTGWGCMKCETQVVAEFTEDEVFTFHCKCSFVEPIRHGHLEPKQFKGGP